MNLLKINPPLSKNALVRDRLFSQMDRGLGRTVLFISAAAGSGKTTLVSSYIQEKNIPCLWYQIDSGDADPATFFYYFGLAGKNAVKERTCDFSVFRPEQFHGICEFSRQFFSDIYASLSPKSLVVFDDFQEAGESPALHDAILAGLDRIPKGITIIMLSRSGPPASFSRLFANRLGSRIQWEDLRFTRDEFKAILEMRQCDMPQDAADRMYRMLDGWIAGFHLSTEVNFNETSTRPAENSPRAVFDYFYIEVFSGLDKRLQDFLIKTVFVSPLSIHMAEAISADPKAEFFLQQLHLNNHFTYKQRQTEVVYHYHPLFRDFLVGQAVRILPREEINALRAAAADMLLKGQRYEEAVTCLRHTENWGRLKAVILRKAPDLILQGRNLSLLKWIGYVPSGFLRQEPWLLFWSGVAKINTNPKKTQKILMQAFNLFEQRQHLTGMLQSWAYVVESILFEYDRLERLDKWIEKLSAMPSHGLESENYSLEVDVTNAMLIACCFRQLDHPEMPHWVARAEALFRQNEDNDKKLLIGNRLIMVTTFIGDFSAACSLIKDCVSIIGKTESIAPMTQMRFFYNKSLYEWLSGELKTCSATVTRALQFADTSGVHLLDNYIVSVGIMAGMGMGKPALVEYKCKKRQSLDRPLNANEKAMVLFIESQQALLKGENAMALNASRQSVRLAGASGFVWSQIMGRIGYGQLLTQTGDSDKGGRLLQTALAAGKKMGSHYITFGALFYSAYHAYCTRNEANGYEFLSQALLLGREQGYLNLHWFNPPVVCELLVKALTAGIEIDYVHAFIRKRKSFFQTVPVQAENWPWPLRIYTLGRFELVIDGQPLRFSGRAQQKPLELLKALIALGGLEVSETRICDALWPDTDGDLQHQTFSTTLHRLRRLLGIKETLVLNDGNLGLEGRYVWVDTWAFERLLDHTDSKKPAGVVSPETEHRLEKAVALYNGPFLENEHSFWAIHAHDKYRRFYLEAMERLGRHHEASQRLSEAIRIYQTALEIHPPVERFYRRIIRCYHQRGDKSEAVATYRRCKEVLSGYMHIQPSARTQEIYRSVSK